MNWIDLVSKLGPTVLATLGTLPALIPLVLDGIQQVEKMAGLVGIEKKARVLALVKDGVQTFNVITKGHKLDANEIVAIADVGIDAVVRTVNMIHELQATA